MRTADALKDMTTRRELLDPNSHRLTTGTPEERDQARREWLRHKRIQQIVDRVERDIPRSELVFGPRWIEHEPTGDFFQVFGGEPEFASNVPAYYVTESGDPVMLQPMTSPANRAELERKRAEREARRNAPPPQRPWVK